MVDIKSRISSARYKLLHRNSGLSVKSSENVSVKEREQQSSPQRSLQQQEQQSSEVPKLIPPAGSSQRSGKKIKTVSTSTLKTPSQSSAKLEDTKRLVQGKGIDNTDTHKATDLDLNFHEDETTPSFDKSGQKSLGPTVGAADLPKGQDQTDGTMDLRLESVRAVRETEKEPIVTIDEPTPEIHLGSDPISQIRIETPLNQGSKQTIPAPLNQSQSYKGRPVPPNLRRQSLVTNANAKIVQTLLDAEGRGLASSELDSADNMPSAVYASMLTRRIWVKRPGASATMIQIREGDLVDDVRETILKKYGNSLGRHFDAPDLTIRTPPAQQAQKSKDRVLGPEEDICRTLDTHYPTGQTVDDALLIDIPQRRTPRPSPHAPQPLYYAPVENMRPVESGTDYFPPMPYPSSPGVPMSSTSHDSRHSQSAHDRAMSVLTTGRVPPLPSPGGNRRSHPNRPAHARKLTSSPTVLANAASIAGIHPTRQGTRARVDSTASASDLKLAPPINSSLGSTPPAHEPLAALTPSPSSPAILSPRLSKAGKKQRKAAAAAASSTIAEAAGADLDAAPTLPAGVLDSFVPPINVLIVEDNMINLKLLEAFMKRLKVQWKTAMNGRDAVKTWRNGGFHLVLMDIQLPIMSGIEATKEIRRLERVNGIGVFGTAGAVGETAGMGVSAAANENVEGGEGKALESAEGGNGEIRSDELRQPLLDEKDRLGDQSFLKTPVIIVALTASSLQSDRHEALAAGCNDFLTKVWRIFFFYKGYYLPPALMCFLCCFWSFFQYYARLCC